MNQYRKIEETSIQKLLSLNIPCKDFIHCNFIFTDNPILQQCTAIGYRELQDSVVLIADYQGKRLFIPHSSNNPFDNFATPIKKSLTSKFKHLDHKVKIEIKENKKEYFLDIDGVFADFEEGFRQLTGKNTDQYEVNDLWNIISLNENFFIDLPKMKEADILWNYFKNKPFTFLSGAPSSTRFREQKVKWVKQHFGTDHIIVLPSKDKPLYAHSKAILVDDNKDNIQEWIAAGGTGILYQNNWKSILPIIEEKGQEYAQRTIQKGF